MGTILCKAINTIIRKKKEPTSNKGTTFICDSQSHTTFYTHLLKY